MHVPWWEVRPAHVGRGWSGGSPPARVQCGGCAEYGGPFGRWSTGRGGIPVQCVVVAGDVYACPPCVRMPAVCSFGLPAGPRTSFRRLFLQSRGAETPRSGDTDRGACSVIPLLQATFCRVGPGAFVFPARARVTKIAAASARQGGPLLIYNTIQYISTTLRRAVVLQCWVHVRVAANAVLVGLSVPTEGFTALVAHSA